MLGTILKAPVRPTTATTFQSLECSGGRDVNREGGQRLSDDHNGWMVMVLATTSEVAIILTARMAGKRIFGTGDASWKQTQSQFVKLMSRLREAQCQHHLV